MSVNLIGKDIQLMRRRYDEALSMQGIPCVYQYPNLPTSNNQGESVVDSYSDKIPTFIFFDSAPKVKTYKRLGWVVENDKNLPFLVRCSFHLPYLQRDCLFTISGQYTNLPDRIFRVTELTCDLQAPDHMVAQVIPCYDNRVAGRTQEEVSRQFSKSNHFLSDPTDYRGNYISSERGEQ